MSSNPLDSIFAPLITTLTEQTADCGCEADKDTELIAKKHAHNVIERERKEAEETIADSQQNREQRKEYAGKIFWLVCAWLAALVLIVWNTGTRFLFLSDAIVIALISGASVNIIGLMVIVANYLFPKNGNPKHEAGKNKQ